MEKHFLFLLSKAPYGSNSARESTDAMMAACAFGQRVSVLVQGDALYQFIRDQQPGALQLKNTAAMLSSLPMYGVDCIVARSEDLEARDLGHDSFVLPVNVIDDKEIQTLIREADVVLSY